MIDEFILRDGGLSETDIALILDPKSNADKTTIAETSQAIQDIMQGRVPKVNYNATAYFLQSLLDFVKTHQDDKIIKKKLNEFLAYIEKHEPIATENEQRRAKNDALAMIQSSMQPGAIPPPSQQPMPMPGGSGQSNLVPQPA